MEELCHCYYRTNLHDFVAFIWQQVSAYDKNIFIDDSSTTLFHVAIVCNTVNFAMLKANPSHQYDVEIQIKRFRG